MSKVGAGRELDALVATEVVGLALQAHENHEWGEEFDVADYHLGRSCVRCHDTYLSCGCDDEPEGPCNTSVLPYSTDIAPAMNDVIGKLRERWNGRLRVFVVLEADGTWSCDLIATTGHGRVGHAVADTAPLAICLAALEAVR